MSQLETPTSRRRADLSVTTHPTLDSWQDAPDNRWVFRHVEELLPSTVVSRTSPTNPDAAPLGVLANVPDLETRLAHQATDALLVERGGKIIGEWYADGFEIDQTHLLMSVSKSLCGIVIGTLIDDGVLDVTALAADYVPELAGSAYGDATLRQLLDMTAAADYSEDYTDPTSEVQAHDRAARWREPRAGDPADTFAFIAGLTRSSSHGERFQYCSAVTDTLGWIIESVTGNRYAEVLSERLWSRIGAEHDARVSVDRGGCALANGGVSCTARDLAKVGRLMLDGGTALGRRVVSAAFVAETLAGGDPELARGSVTREVFPEMSYRNQWWSSGNERGNVYGVGIHGQYLWLDPKSDTVIVKFSTLAAPVAISATRDATELFSDILAAS